MSVPLASGNADKSMLKIYTPEIIFFVSLKCGSESEESR